MNLWKVSSEKLFSYIMRPFLDPGPPAWCSGVGWFATTASVLQ